MNSPYTRLRTEDEELMFDAGQMDGRDRERKRILDDLYKLRAFMRAKSCGNAPPLLT